MYYHGKTYEERAQLAEAKVERLEKQALAFATRLAEIEPLGSDDWGCVQCHPNSDILIDGFVCSTHQAIALVRQPIAL